VLAGNLPYNISKPVALKLVAERAALDRAVLMFQREVAARLTARPDSRDYGPLTVLCGEVFRVERLFDLPAQAFRPRPRVVSTVTRWHRRPAADLDDLGERRLRAVLSASFARRRQTLRNNLRAALGADAAEALLERTGLDGAARAEQLVPAAFRSLAAQWPD
jgi:16S rRNA (adenine1518-N6/adenine1519-N6)-dimethyltransferase